MRNVIRGAVALVVLVALYWGWALYGVSQLASAAKRGDAVAVMERVDLPAVSRSLSGQISRAYIEQNPALQKLLASKTGDGLAINAAAAEMLLRAYLTPENLAALLNQGRLANADANSGSVWRMPALGEAFEGGGWRAVLNSHFDSPLGFVVGLDSPDGRYNVHMGLNGTTWRLSGVDIPDAVTARVAREIAQRIGGAMDTHGG